MNLRKIKYSRGQQISFVVLACFIVTCFLINQSLKNFYPHNNQYFSPDSTLLTKINQFEKGLDSIEWQREKDFKPRIVKILKREKFTFDPNSIDSIDIIRLGFQPYMAHNWLQYRRHGGKFLSISKLRSIYNIDTLLVDSLKEYITINSTLSETKNDTTKYKKKLFTQFEINSADTSILCQFPGIGKGRAKMIINYRQSLGGFYSANQLCEIENIPDSIIDNLIPFIEIELDSIKKIDINKASIKRLHHHPYISYYQAKAIYNLRWDKKHNGTIKNLEDIQNLKEFTNDDFERIKYYIEIKEPN